jgi:hypothetical protein
LTNTAAGVICCQSSGEQPLPLIQNILTGIAATLLAGVAVLCALALGEAVTRRVEAPMLRLASALIVGFAMTSFVIAIIAASISARAAIIADVTLGGAALIVNWRGCLSMLRSTNTSLITIFASSRLARTGFVAAAALYWLDAIAPPRDGDVMRYHLAHIAQILRDGKWQGIADYHYALPFGWTFNYLPFEALGIPQAAHMLNLAAVFITAVLAISFAPPARFRPAALIALLFVVHPAVLKAGTTAFADAYTMLVVLTATMLVSQTIRSESSAAAAFLTGIIAWAGIQSRYQVIGFGVAASAAFFFMSSGPEKNGARRLTFTLGAIAAVLLASPFFIMNFHEFGNPLWPFFVQGGAGESYANVVGAAYQKSQTGQHSIAELTFGLKRLVTYRDMIPIPFVVAIGILWGWLRHRAALRTPLVIATTFVFLWIVAQPRLYPRFVIYFLPVAILLWIGIVAKSSGEGKSRLIGPALVLGAFALFGADLVYSSDSLQYVATGNASRFHRQTWYYPVYRWVNAHTPQDSRFAVIVWSGYSYYLDRQYRRADPWLAGEIDWNQVDTPAELQQVLDARGIDFLIYEDRNWSGLRGGQNMMRAVSESIRAGSLIPVRKFHERLYTSRLSRSFFESDVYVLRTLRSVTIDKRGS